MASHDRTRRSAVWDLWGQGTPTFPVAGESHYEKALLHLLGGMPPSTGREIEAQAILVPEPTNRYDRNAVRVVIEEETVGYLPGDRCGTYVGILAHLGANGFRARVRAQVRGYRFMDQVETRTGWREEPRLGASVRLSLAEPHLLMPVPHQVR